MEEFLNDVNLQGDIGEDIKIDSKKGWKLKQAMQKALKELSMLPDTSVGLECWLTDDSKDFVMDLKRVDLEASTAPVVYRSARASRSSSPRHLQTKTKSQLI